MNKFVIKYFKIIIIPFLFIIFFCFYWDPFKIYFSYDDYYRNNKINGNREYICYKMYKSRKKPIYNLIIGNSRSQAFKTIFLHKYLGGDIDNYFHWDGAGYGLYRTKNSLKFLEKSEKKIKNILLVIDAEFLTEIKNPASHLKIQPPEVSGESYFSFYTKFLLPSMNINFIFSNLIFNITGNYYDFMGHYLLKSSNDIKFLKVTSDIFYAEDIDINNDSIYYYKNLEKKGIFYSRNKKQRVGISVIGRYQKEMLAEIKQICKNNNININIVISPLYDQIKFNTTDLLFLYSLFGRSNVYDFSGKNNFTNDFKNYYENSHFKPYIANQIIDSIYNYK
jgi:hypothetical protein